MATARTEISAIPIPPIEVPATNSDLLRFSTAGSVDDGKSTLIGRLLYDSQAVYEDQLTAVRKSRINRSTGPLDFSLLTDGLRAEREQGITIDVAYRYFATPRRKFIIADTPGHEQYTRNMATGASTADATVVLVDATKGLLPQSLRHIYIANLLGVQYLIAAVNKMDLIGYSQEAFERIARSIDDLGQVLGVTNIYAVPVSALEGDNVVESSSRMPWFEGPPLLQYLETIRLKRSSEPGKLRFPVQYVIRPDAHFRGFAGQVACGVLRPGADIVALPSGRSTRVKSIVTYDRELREATAGDSVAVVLEDEIDLSRGDMLVAQTDRPHIVRNFQAKLVWMHAEAMDARKLYVLKHTTRVVRARVAKVLHRIDVNSFAEVSSAPLQMNDIGTVQIETTLPLFFDFYRQVHSTGSFILIDPLSNATVAAGMIEALINDHPMQRPAAAGPVSKAERRQRFGHGHGAAWVSGWGVAEQVERVLFAEGWNVKLLEAAEQQLSQLPQTLSVLFDAGVFVLIAESEDAKGAVAVQEIAGDRFIDVSGFAGRNAPRLIVERLRQWTEASQSAGEAL